MGRNARTKRFRNGTERLQTEILAILFADARGYSGLTEFQLKVFFKEVLPKVGSIFQKYSSYEPNSWGDGFVGFFKEPAAAARCALEIRDLFNKENWSDKGLPDDLSVRIGLHSAPVYVGPDPVRGRRGVVGTQVNLAARIEPVVPAGYVYATKTFVENLGRQPQTKIRYEEVGPTELAKGWGIEVLFNIRWAIDQVGQLPPIKPQPRLPPLPSSEIEPLLPMLRGRNDALKRLTIDALTHSSGEMGALEPLIELLKDREGNLAELRGNAAWALSRLKDERAVLALIEALNDPDEFVKGPAITALGELGDIRALDPLVKVLEDREGTKGDIRGAAATALGRLSDRRTTPPLIEALEDPDERAKGPAITALGELGDIRALDPLVKVLEDREGTKGFLRAVAATALGTLNDSRIVPALIEALEDPDEHVKMCAVIALGKLENPLALESLVGVLKDRERAKGFLRAAAATALGRLNDSRAVLPLIGALEDPDELIQRTAATALGNLDDVRALKPLVAVLLDREKSGTRSRSTAATALRHLGDTRAVPPLIEVLEDSDALVKGSAISSLGELGDIRALDPLVKVLEDREGTKGFLRATAASALWRLKDIQAVIPLIQALDDPDDVVKINVISALGILGDRRASEPIGRLALDSANTPHLRNVAVTSLALIGDASAESVANSILSNKEEPDEVLYSAVVLLGRLGTKSATSILQTILSRNDELSVHAAHILSQGPAGTREMLEKSLIEITTKKKNTTTKKAQHKWSHNGTGFFNTLTCFWLNSSLSYRVCVFL